ncbi:uncharacterized protein Z518_05785 [Rhinocladiella mackenziei CBS 650.93]|uniref:Rhinocladiella mackenziei CBS 650.93 unplaced genomic scaffold supercont1.4, whole genome shotgun sequence n=1 Tax=Rhinocladiella mackenziei CBS 650.93 TaxID=1442369 RepID=A0A0D2IGM6_9EURO|nr:uncharacterized protein Z518_05785 [Rhinocladiella mackenziei CBS 650.93]KIX04914.1 hypothetical protein Z518_05785 [Rhinocladiella mackenziei CBS 650.93]
MVPWEKITKLIGGRGVAEKSEQKKLEKQYEDAPKALKQLTEVTKEPPAEYPSRPLSIYSAPLSDRHNPRERSLLSAQRPNYERSVSSPAAPAILTQRTPTGPPDITAGDLSTEELKRNYSCDSIWNFKSQPLPPMPRMTGFGRYRRAANASAEWQLEHVHRHLHDVRGVIVNHLGDCPPAGLDLETWREYRAQHPRTSSFGSSYSSDSGPFHTGATEYIDLNTGTRVSRGFGASATSSVTSSFNDGSGHYRRDSTLSKTSMASPSSEGDAKLSRRSSRTSPHRHTSSTSISHLTAIREMQETQTNPPRKVARPCDFDENRNHENALASDEDDEFDWSDMLEVGGGNVSNLTKGLERRPSSKGVPNARPALTRLRTNPQERPKSLYGKKTVSCRSKPVKMAPRTDRHRVRLHKRPTEGTRTASQESKKTQKESHSPVETCQTQPNTMQEA